MVTTFIGPIGAETPLIGSIKQQQVKEEGNGVPLRDTPTWRATVWANIKLANKRLL